MKERIAPVAAKDVYTCDRCGKRETLLAQDHRNRPSNWNEIQIPFSEDLFLCDDCSKAVVQPLVPATPPPLIGQRIRQAEGEVPF